MPWANERREELRRLYAVALTGMGRIHLRKNELNRALGYLSRAAREAPEREDVHRDVIRLYLQFGMVHEARQQYDMMKQVLEQAGGLQPTKESRDLLEQIKSKS
jgi:DNA-binding SARP family transcriptional activator